MGSTLLVEKSSLEQPAYNGSGEEMGSPIQACIGKPKEPEDNLPEPEIVNIFYGDASGSPINELQSEKEVYLIVQTKNMSGDTLIIPLYKTDTPLKFDGQEVDPDKHVLRHQVEGGEDKIKFEPYVTSPDNGIAEQEPDGPGWNYPTDDLSDIIPEQETVTINLVRKWETSTSTIGEFSITNTDIVGYILEEKGPSTTVSGLERRIPAGTYNLKMHNGTKFQDVLKLYNSEVPESRAILIHAGNSAADTEGCLLPGMTKGTDFVGDSRTALGKIMDYVEEIGVEGAVIHIFENYQ